MIVRTIPCVAVLALAIASGCTRKTSDRDLVFLNSFQAVERVNAQPKFLEKRLRTVWVDPRTPELYAQEHIAGAVSLPFPRMQAEAEFVLKGYDQFIVYDTDWEDTIGEAASKRLMELGFDNVYTLEGGLKAWKRDQNPVVGDGAAPTKAPPSGDAKPAGSAAPASPPAPAAPAAPVAPAGTAAAPAKPGA